LPLQFDWRAVLPRIDWALALTNSGLAADVTERPVRIDHGFADVLDRPGLGIDIDEDRLRRHRVRAGRGFRRNEAHATLHAESNAKPSIGSKRP
jgi:hypothetical protein